MFSRNARIAARSAFWILIPLSLHFLAGCSGGDGARSDESEMDPSSDPERWEGDLVAATRMLRPKEGTARDWDIVRDIVMRAWEEGLDTLPMGQAMAQIGLKFLDSPYAPGTLELAGEEDVVVNLEEFDCVTLVENVLALSRFIKTNGPEILESETRVRNAFTGALREIRYRNARVDGYVSRLHYFSDWIRDNEIKGLVREVTREFGGTVDPKAIDFMSTHPEAYRQLGSPTNLAAIRSLEYELSDLDRYKISEEDITDPLARIQDGDIIAATSTVDGLDVAHTGIAYWEDTELHLLHAPLVGGTVEVSRHPLADRILRLTGQDGIRVVRPLDPSREPGDEVPSP